MTSPLAPEVLRAAEALRRFGAREVYLFGSRARATPRADSDIDLAVRGLPPEKFYRAVAEALSVSPVPLDVVDLDDPGPLMDLLRRKGDFVRVF